MFGVGRLFRLSLRVEPRGEAYGKNINIKFSINIRSVEPDPADDCIIPRPVPNFTRHSMAHIYFKCFFLLRSGKKKKNTKYSYSNEKNNEVAPNLSDALKSSI